MDCIFNKEKLKKALYDFYTSTGIAITLYDAAENIVATSPVFTGYCSLIRSKKKCVENCDLSNFVHMKEVSKSRGISRYTCHAGLMETILPIMYEGILVAYLQIGQFRDKGGMCFEPIAIEVAEKYGYNASELCSLYENVPVVSDEKLDAMCRILEILIKSFWLDDLITYKRSMLSVKIEQYIDERLTEKIVFGDLCEKFFLSKNALYRLFRDEFGTTVTEFIIQKRLQLAQKYLRSENDMNVSQISSACGFSDYNYFIRLFKKRFGVTPFQYRRQRP